MKTLTELQGEREHRLRSMKYIIDRTEKEDRAMTEDEKVEFDGFQKEGESLATQIEELEETVKRAQIANDAIDDLTKTKKQTRITTPAQPGSEGDDGIHFPERLQRQYQFARLKAFENNPEGERGAYITGQWVLGNFVGNAPARRWCDSNLAKPSTWAMSEGTNTAGGIVVPTETERAIIIRREEYGVFRKNTFVASMGSDLMNIPRRAGGATAAFVNESGTVGESDPSFNQVELKAQKLGVLTRFSSELSEDAIINIGDWIVQEFAYGFALKEDQCGFTGTGTATFGSIEGVAFKFTNDNTLAGAVDTATANADTFAEIALVDLNTLMAALPAYARPNAKWYCSSTCQDLVFNRITAAAGGNTIATLEGGFQPMALGHPIVVSQVMTASTGSLDNTTMFLFGDLALASTMGDRRGIRIGLSDQRYFELDQIAIKATERFDISVHDVGNATTAGSIVAMIGTV